MCDEGVEEMQHNMMLYCRKYQREKGGVRLYCPNLISYPQPQHVMKQEISPDQEKVLQALGMELTTSEMGKLLLNQLAEEVPHSQSELWEAVPSGGSGTTRCGYE